MSERDYYALLRVRRTASPRELKRAYRARARELHVDGQPLSAFLAVAQAYAVLSDSMKRRVYDGTARGESISALFETPEGSRVLELHFGGRPIDPLPGADMHLTWNVPRAILESEGIVEVTLPPDSLCAGEVLLLRMPLDSLRRRFVVLHGLGAPGEHIKESGAEGTPGDLIILLNAF